MLVALRVGVAILGASQTIWAAMRSPLICIIVAPLLAVPATIAGYHTSLGLAAPAERRREALALVGATATNG